jgi:hypothetical protein
MKSIRISLLPAALLFMACGSPPLRAADPPGDVVLLGLLQDVTAPPDRIVHQVLIKAPTNSIYSIDLRLVYEPGTASLLQAEAGEFAVGMLFLLNTNQPGVIRVAYATGSPMGGEGVLLTLTFAASASVTTTIAEARVNEGSLSVTVATNTAPHLTTPADQIIAERIALTVTPTANDSDWPTNKLTFQLVSGPQGAALDPDGGVFTWTPPFTGVSSTNPVTVRVSDNGVPSLSDTRTFNIVVATRPRLLGIDEVNGSVVLVWSVLPGLKYQFQYKEDLLTSEWRSFGGEFSAAAATAALTDTAPATIHRFYRILQLPNP